VAAGVMALKSGDRFGDLAIVPVRPFPRRRALPVSPKRRRRPRLPPTLALLRKRKSQQT